MWVILIAKQGSNKAQFLFSKVSLSPSQLTFFTLFLSEVLNEDTVVNETAYTEAGRAFEPRE